MPPDAESPNPSDPGFAPEDLTDGRGPGEWRSRYEPEAWRFIWQETAYLATTLVAVGVLMVITWTGGPAMLWRLSEAQQQIVLRYGFAWLGGTLGGTLFAMKWLYHSIAKQSWHVDRRVWRFLTPHISGGLAFGTLAIVNSVPIFKSDLSSTAGRTLALGFLVGLFSDNALAKLAEVAETLFGRTHRTSERAHEPAGKKAAATQADAQ